jgi:hypothetical protein
VITLDQYFGIYITHVDASPGMWANAEVLLDRVNGLLEEAKLSYNINIATDPDTRCHIGGNVNGGFRPKDCKEGAPNSSHKQGRGIDIYDPLNTLDDWIDDAKLVAHGLYREAPSSTAGWVHLTTRAPSSGKRTFNP